MHTLSRALSNKSKSMHHLSELVCSSKFSTCIDGTPSSAGTTVSVLKARLKVSLLLRPLMSFGTFKVYGDAYRPTIPWLYLNSSLSLRGGYESSSLPLHLPVGEPRR